MDNFSFSDPDHFAVFFELIELENGGYVAPKADKEIVVGLKAQLKQRVLNFNHIHPEFQSPLYIAAANDRPLTVEFLLAHTNADPNLQVVEQLTAFHVAMGLGHQAVADKFFKSPPEKKVNWLLKNQYGETALVKACDIKDPAKRWRLMSTMLEQAPAIVHCETEDGIYPIELALELGAPSLIQLMLDKGAKLSNRIYQRAANIMVKRSQRYGDILYAHNMPEHIKESCRLVITEYNRRRPVKSESKNTTARPAPKP